MANQKRRRRVSVAVMNSIDSTVLQFIGEHRNVNRARLEKHTKASPATISRVVKRLTEQGKIERVVNKGKGRPVSFKVADGTFVAPVQTTKRVFPTIKLADKTRKVHFSVLDENGVQVIDVKGDASDSKILSIMSELAGVKSTR